MLSRLSETIRARLSRDTGAIDLVSAVEGRVIYLFVLIALIQFIYPMTMTASILPLFLYNILYAAMIVVGVVVARDHPPLVLMIAILGMTYLMTGVIYGFNRDAEWALYLACIALIPYQLMLIAVLVRFIFTSSRVNRDVIYAACSVYLLLGALFVPIYGVLETLDTSTPALMDVTAPSAEVPWQTLVYFSYTTLTSLGYGDIYPIDPWARSVSSVESIVGVLYTTIVVARLVGVYANLEAKGSIDGNSDDSIEADDDRSEEHL